MRDRKADRCPRCGGKFVPDPYSDRTVPGGTWYVVRCRNCGHVEDVFKPRRSKKTEG